MIAKDKVTLWIKEDSADDTNFLIYAPPTPESKGDSKVYLCSIFCDYMCVLLGSNVWNILHQHVSNDQLTRFELIVEFDTE